MKLKKLVFSVFLFLSLISVSFGTVHIINITPVEDIPIKTQNLTFSGLYEPFELIEKKTQMFDFIEKISIQTGFVNCRNIKGEMICTRQNLIYSNKFLN